MDQQELLKHMEDVYNHLNEDPNILQLTMTPEQREAVLTALVIALEY